MLFPIQHHNKGGLIRCTLQLVWNKTTLYFYLGSLAETWLDSGQKFYWNYLVSFVYFLEIQHTIVCFPHAHITQVVFLKKLVAHLKEYTVNI